MFRVNLTRSALLFSLGGILDDLRIEAVGHVVAEGRQAEAALGVGRIDLGEDRVEIQVVEMLGAAADLAEQLGAQWVGITQLAPVEHGFTHYHLTITPIVARMRDDGGAVARESAHVWMPLAQAPDAGVPAPVRKLLSVLQAPDLFG